MVSKSRLLTKIAAYASNQAKKGQSGRTRRKIPFCHSNPDHVEKHMHSAGSSCTYHDPCLEHACEKETHHEIDTVLSDPCLEPMNVSVSSNELQNIQRNCP